MYSLPFGLRLIGNHFDLMHDDDPSTHIVMMQKLPH